MNIVLGKDSVSLLDPPNDGFVKDGGEMWKIGRTGSGNIALRRAGDVHPDFLPDGMDLVSFCEWINRRAQ